jgi:branched-chain amino acid transport system ATP-binding protein/urea transport system ATP-binding protein
MIVEAIGVWRKFGGVAAIAGVNFSLPAGELRCLIGANGAGKSTFFKMLTGQIKPSMGSIRIMGEDVAKLQPFEIARLGVSIKTQVPSVYNGLSVRENLFLAARRGLGARRATQVADDMMAELGLESYADTDVVRLAHGQRQWVELGMVLVGRPKLMLLDEPTAGMTRHEVERTVALLGRLRGERTIVVVEHDMHFIRRIADKVTVFHRGRVLAEDTMEAVLRNQDVREVYLGRRIDERS